MIPSVNELHNKYISLAFVALKRTIPPDIRRNIIERGLHDDLEQEIYITALEGMNLYPSLGNNKYLNFAGRQLYLFLKQNGYRRPKNYGSYIHDMSFNTAIDTSKTCLIFAII